MTSLRRVALALALVSGCGDERGPAERPLGPPPGAAPEPAAPAASIDETPLPLGFSGETTPGDQALARLIGQLDADEAAVARRPDVLAFRSALVDALVSLATFAGRFSGFERADALTVDLSGDADSLVLRARVLGAIHRFAEADRLLVQASQVGAGDVAVARSTIALALGRQDDDVLRVREDMVARWPSFRTHAELAVVLAARGRFEEADAAYLRALAAYRDVSPFPIAWLQFQRGVMWAEMADRSDRALPLYEEAVRRLPGFVSANVHLAELELEGGDRDRAIARLVPLAERTEDPEPLGRLAEWLVEADPAKSRAYADRARAAYDRLLAVYPLAFADHASEFFAAAGGDPARALALAEQNLAARQPPRAYLLALDAADAAGASARLCELLASVPAAATSANVNLRVRVTELTPRCLRL